MSEKPPIAKKKKGKKSKKQSGTSSPVCIFLSAKSSLTKGFFRVFLSVFSFFHKFLLKGTLRPSVFL